MNIAKGASLSYGARLRALLRADQPCQLMGAHDGLSARIAGSEGFEALWASGLCMSTALGVRDCDEASWSELLTIAASMVDSTDLPVLVDGDSGYGNFNNARRFSRRAERSGAAGICFEDKIFPKVNSFVSDDHDLAPIAEFCGKIRACKDGQADDAFVLVARTEAFIADKPLQEALDRAHAYAEAGADAIFVHSRKPTAVEIRSFTDAWQGDIPVIVAPTTYASTTRAELGQMRVAGIIFANQAMRAAFDAMRQLCRQVLQDEGVDGVEAQITPLKEIFALLDYHGLAEDRVRYSGAEGTAPA